MIAYEQALTILQQAKPLDTIVLSTQDACGYVLAQDVTSNVHVPSFDNSAMDGFAVRSQDLSAASLALPVVLKITGISFAGDTRACGIGGAWKVMTGAPIPTGYDAVVKKEDTVVKNNKVQFMHPITAKANTRQVGQDFIKGGCVAPSQSVITPYHIMALSAVGQHCVRVYRKPKITVISTGKELVENNGTPLQQGQIYNTSAPYIKSALQDMGYASHYAGIIADDPLAFKATLNSIVPQTDVVISTGAVSVGQTDFVAELLNRLGAEIVFHKVAVQPGKPILYARFANGTHYFGLPGNPISTVVGVRFFVEPLLRCLQAIPFECPLTARLSAAVSKQQGIRWFRKARLSFSAQGVLYVALLDGQESFKIHPMLQANGWAVLTEDQKTLEKEKPIAVYPLTPHQWNLAP